MAESTIARDQLKSIVERIERLEEDGEAKANGFDVKILRQVVRLRKQDLTERQEQDAVRDLYLHALGMIPDPSENSSAS